MKIGYIIISKSDGSQNLDLQVNPLLDTGVSQYKMCNYKALEIKEKRSGLKIILKY